MTAKPDKFRTATWVADLEARVRDDAEKDSAKRLVDDAMRALLDDGPPTCITDPDGRPIYANTAFEGIADALAAAGIAPQRPKPASRQPGTGGGAEALAAVEALRGPIEREHSMVVEGRTEHYRLSQRTLHGEDGQCIATVSVFTAVTDEKSTSAKLAMVSERLEDITRLVSDWVWETNRNLVLTSVSPRVSEALGYHQVELTGRHLTDLLVQPNDALNALGTAKGHRPFRNVEVGIADRQGKLRHFLLSGLPVYCPTSGSFLGFRGTAHDVTELKWRQEALLQAKEDAEAANRAKGEFLATMSHELRTPLNAIIGFSDIMSSEMLGPFGNEQYKGYSKDISESARHLLVLINDILDAAKIEAGQMSLTEETVDPVALIESVQRLVAPRAERAGLTLQVHLPANVPPLYADKTKLKQILINLVSNAVKFTREGGRVELRVEVAESGEFVFIVSDTGIGIEADDVARALAPFGQVDSRLSRKFEGTGLGLPLAKSLTELHSGTFRLVSQPNVGTTVTVRLPAVRVLRA